MLNRFWSLSKKYFTTPDLNGQYQAGRNGNQGSIKNLSLFYIVCQVLRRHFCEKL